MPKAALSSGKMGAHQLRECDLSRPTIDDGLLDEWNDVAPPAGAESEPAGNQRNMKGEDDGVDCITFCCIGSSDGGRLIFCRYHVEASAGQQHEEGPSPTGRRSTGQNGAWPQLRRDSISAQCRAMKMGI